MNKTIFNLAILGSAFLFSPFVEAGVDSSGGGTAVVCRDGNHAISRIELLDLFEGRSVYGLTYVNNTDTTDDQIFAVYEKAATTMVQPQIDLFSALTRVRRIAKILPQGTHLSAINDAYPIVLPDGCRLEQFASYIDDGVLSIDAELWDAADQTNRAALYLHEAVYRLARGEGATDSRFSRRVVSYLFSTTILDPVIDGIPANARWCETHDSVGRTIDRFAVYPESLIINKKPATVLQFTKKDRSTLFTKTTLTSPWTAWEEPALSGNFAFASIQSKLQSENVNLGFMSLELDGTPYKFFYIDHRADILGNDPRTGIPNGLSQFMCF